MDGLQAAVMRALCEEHTAATLRYALRLTGERAHAKHVAQETLIRPPQHPELADVSEGSARVQRHPDHRVQPHPAGRDVPGQGLGHRGRRASAELSQALLLGHLPQRPCAPTVFQDRGQRDLLQRHHHRLPAAAPRRRPGTQTGDAAGALHDALGIREVSYTKGQQARALKEQKLQ
jgi:hypothetical protein